MTCILLITLARNVSRLKDCNTVMTVIKHRYTVNDKIEFGALLAFKQAFMLGFRVGFRGGSSCDLDVKACGYLKMSPECNKLS